MPYFLLSMMEDGYLHIQNLSEKELLEQLTPDEDGYAEYDFSNISSKIPDEYSEHWGNKFIIIKGEIIVPKAKQVATKFEL